jgi:hypothetical protein
MSNLLNKDSFANMTDVLIDNNEVLGFKTKYFERPLLQ